MPQPKMHKPFKISIKHAFHVTHKLKTHRDNAASCSQSCCHYEATVARGNMCMLISILQFFVVIKLLEKYSIFIV